MKHRVAYITYNFNLALTSCRSNCTAVVAHYYRLRLWTRRLRHPLALQAAAPT